MEKELYREHLCRLREVFPDTDFITVTEAAKYLHVDKRTLLNDKHTPTVKIRTRYVIPLINLARWLA